jgi:hypothetical protein
MDLDGPDEIHGARAGFRQSFLELPLLGLGFAGLLGKPRR